LKVCEEIPAKDVRYKMTPHPVLSLYLTTNIIRGKKLIQNNCVQISVNGPNRKLGVQY